MSSKKLKTLSKKNSNLLTLMSKHIDCTQFEQAQEFLKYLISKIKQSSFDIYNVNILISYGGGKDSTWVVVFIRLVQLLCQKEYGVTFNIKLITMVHLGMTKSVFDNIHLLYNLLGIYSGEKISADIFCYGKIIPFDHLYKIPKSIRKLFRDDVLLTGHMSQGDPRATFCYSCNLYMLNSIISKFRKRIHFVVTGDSKSELRNFRGWLQDIFKQAALEPLYEMDNFTHLANRVTELSCIFFSDLYPDGEVSHHLRIVPLVEKESIETFWITVFNFTQYSFEDHCDFITRFLGFKFSEDSFNFTESDCIYPLLMGHLRGLSAEIEGRGYNQGIREYLELVKELMEEKIFPQELIKLSLNKYKTDIDIKKMREKAQKCANELLQITEQQMICMIYSPVTDRGRNLWKYLEERSSELLPKVKEIHDFLAGNDNVDKKIVEFFISRTALSTQQLRHLYKHPLMRPQILNKKKTTQYYQNLFEIFRKKDPYKKKIKYINSQGRKVHEIIRGK